MQLTIFVEKSDFYDSVQKNCRLIKDDLLKEKWFRYGIYVESNWSKAIGIRNLSGEMDSWR